MLLHVCEKAPMRFGALLIGLPGIRHLRRRVSRSVVIK